MKLNDWEQHIQKTPVDRQAGKPGEAYCGADLWSHDWVFQSPDHARKAVEKGTRMQPCLHCWEGIENE